VQGKTGFELGSVVTGSSIVEKTAAACKEEVEPRGGHNETATARFSWAENDAEEGRVCTNRWLLFKQEAR
jgi:hypothetical protein